MPRAGARCQVPGGCQMSVVVGVLIWIAIVVFSVPLVLLLWVLARAWRSR